MQANILGKTNRTVSAVGLGTWQLGADWGEVSEADALSVLGASADAGVTFFDTADVYGDGRSEQLIGRFLRTRGEGSGITVATKMGRRMEQVPENYVLKNFRAWTDRSRKNLGVDTLDLIQLHCPPTATVTSDEVYDALDTLIEEGAIAGYGLSVETCAQALSAIARPNVATIQIILNAFRLKPLEQVLPAAREVGVGIIARVPLASGLLTGKYTAATTFADNDHRTFNRDGGRFDVGETFSGVEFGTGLEAARSFAALAAGVDGTTAQAALAWVSQLEGVSSVIPGARSTAQAEANAAAGSLPELGAGFTAGVQAIYDELLRSDIHPRW